MKKGLVLAAFLLFLIPFLANAQEVIFSEPVNVSNSPLSSLFPKIAIDGAGVINVAWEEGPHIQFSRSLDGGETFTEPVFVSTLPSFSAGQLDVVGTSDGTAHVTWAHFFPDGGSEVLYSRSTDGTEFSDFIVVSNEGSPISYNPSMATDGVSRTGIVWIGFRPIFFSRSIDNGDTFSEPMPLSSAPGLCPAIVMLGADNVYIAWSQVHPTEEPEIFFSLSLDAGETFSSPVNISGLPEQSWCPKIALDATAIIYVVWEEGAAFRNRKVMFSQSTDGGISFSIPAILSSAMVDSFCSAVAAEGDGRVYVTWSTGDFEAHETFVSFSSDGGVTFSGPLKIPVISGTGRCPHIASVEPNQFSIVWYDLALSDIFYSRGLVSIP